MEIWGDFHTHTRYSHGKGTIRENVEAAIEKGLSTIGISEHGPSNIAIGTKLEDFYSMKREVEELREIFPNIEILLGCEANVISIDGHIDIPEEILHILDYVMVGLHPLVWTKTLKDANHLLFKNVIARVCKIEALKKRVLVQNTRALIKAIKHYKVKAITHPGLHLPIDTALLAREAAKYGTALEINAGHNNMTKEYIKIALDNGASFIVGSDAHKPRDVGNFDKVMDVIADAGLSWEHIIKATSP